MWRNTSLSKHFISTDVKAIGLKLFKLQSVVVLETGMITDVFRQVGMMALVKERLRILVRIPESWSAHTESTFPGTPSGPEAFLGFTFLNSLLT